jgi:hypothetical protein
MVLRLFGGTDDATDEHWPGKQIRIAGRTADMSTITRESLRSALPQTGRGDVILALAAVLVCLMATILKLSGVA